MQRNNFFNERREAFKIGSLAGGVLGFLGMTSWIAYCALQRGQLATTREASICGDSGFSECVILFKMMSIFKASTHAAMIGGMGLMMHLNPQAENPEPAIAAPNPNANAEPREQPGLRRR
jgi:hypothetical protein